MSGVCTFVYHAFTGCWGNRHNKTAKASSRPTHTTSVRGNLVKTYKIDINDDYILDIDQELGKGGCGVVVVGEHKELRTQYAIKIVDKSHAERGRLDRELKLLKDVDHTNIVRLFSVYDVPSHMYFVMELCLGGHLGNLLARQPRKYLDETWAKQLALQLLSAVAHIHSRGIAHRDIKLQNILVDQCTNDRTAQLKLIDFGYGSRFIGALPMRTKCGTPYTTAPEVIRECYDERCDVWSCGVVLYIMLCGRRPFEALNCSGTLADAGKAAMITNILAGRYHFNHKAWQTVSKQGVNFVKALLHPDYKQRMHSHEALENPWLIDSNIINVHAHILRSEKSFQAANNIRRMSEVSELHRAGMVALVFGINANTAAEMSAVFQSFDSDASGMLSKSEFCTAMQKIVPELTSSDLNKLFEIIDYDKNSLISYTEFLAATLDPREMDIGELNKAFRLFDEDGNGYISKDEMRKVGFYSLLPTCLTAVGGFVLTSRLSWCVHALVQVIRMQCEQALANHQQLALQQALSPRSLNSHDTLAADMDALDAEVTAKVERIFAEADVNNDGAISHAEFLWVMTGLDFHLLERVGMPSEIGVSAKDTFMYNTKLNNSYDSAEDWNQDIDQPFEMEAGYAINGSSSNRQSKGPSYEPAIMLSATGSSTSFGRSFMKSPNRSLKQDALLDALMEKPADEPSSDGFPSGSERVLQVGVQSGPEAEAERPMQRHSRRPRDESVAAPRVDSPYLLAGLLKTPSGGVYQDELTCADPVVGGQGPAAPLGKQSSLAFYNEPPSISSKFPPRIHLLSSLMVTNVRHLCCHSCSPASGRRRHGQPSQPVRQPHAEAASTIAVPRQQRAVRRGHRGAPAGQPPAQRQVRQHKSL